MLKARKLFSRLSQVYNAMQENAVAMQAADLRTHLYERILLAGMLT
jgi:hypothetical protein